MATRRPFSIGDRLAAAAVGAFVGAIVGALLSWMFGVYSQSMGASQVPVSAGEVTLSVAGFFAVLGLLIGPHVGTVLGNTISAILEFEGRSDPDIPTWLAVTVLVGIVIALWWAVG